MATLLDIGILSSVMPIFSLIFVMAVVFGVLTLTKVFGDNKGIYALIAFILGIMVLVVPGINAMIATMMPWFTFFFIFIIFLLVIYKIFGATDDDIVGVLRADSTVVWIILIICFVIVAGAAAKIYGPSMLGGKDRTVSGVVGEGAELAGEPGSTSSTSYYQNIGATFFHPKVLGFGLIFLIAVLAISILAMRPR